jgi:hypothetical protein
VNVGLEVIGDRLAKMRRGVRQDAAGAGERIGQAFPHVADNELQSGQAIEEAGDDEAEGMKAGLSVPAPARDGEKKAEFTGKAGIIGHADRLGRRRGVEVDGNSKMSGGLKDREEARIVKKKAIGGAIEESAVKSKACDTALQLSRCRGGRLQGKRGKSAKTGGMGRTASASSSLTSWASELAVSASSASKPIAASESTWRSMPDLSMSAIRPAPRSRSLGCSSASCGRVLSPLVRVACRKDSVTKCSSSVMVRIVDTTMPERREFPEYGMRLIELDTDLIQSASPHEEWSGAGKVR